MKQKENRKKEVLAILRKEAEKMITANLSKKDSGIISQKDIKKLLHELEIYQVELEMQNDELRISQEELEKERLKFAGLFNLAPVGYFILDQSAVIEECNDTAINILNTSRIQLLEKRFLNFVMPVDNDAFYAFLHKISTTKKAQTCYLKMRTATKKMFYGQMEGIIIVNPVSRRSFYYFAVIDVTEKRIIEINQAEIQDKLQMALSASSTGTISINYNSEKIDLDEFAASIFGLSKGELILDYKSFLRIIYPEDRKKTNNKIKEAILNKDECSFEFRVILPDNTIHYLETRGHTKNVSDEDNFFSGVIMDITEKKKLYEETQRIKINQQKNILRAVIETEESERSRISNVIHDSLGQLLYATSLNLGKSNDAATKNAANLLNEAIKQTRNISFELAPPILTDFGMIIALEEMIKRLSGPGLRFTIKASGLEPRLKISSEVFIFRIIQELINNVIRHSQATIGSIDITRKSNNLILKIKDNGIGFSATDQVRSGSGFYSIKNRLALYNGYMEINSKEKTGTTVTVKIFDIK